MWHRNWLLVEFAIGGIGWIGRIVIRKLVGTTSAIHGKRPSATDRADSPKRSSNPHPADPAAPQIHPADSDPKPTRQKNKTKTKRFPVGHRFNGIRQGCVGSNRLQLVNPTHSLHLMRLSQANVLKCRVFSRPPVMMRSRSARSKRKIVRREK